MIKVVAFWISLTAFLVLCASASIKALFVCLVNVLCLGAVLFKYKQKIADKLSQPFFSPSWLIGGGIAALAGIKFYETWCVSSLIGSLASKFGLSGTAFTFAGSLLLTVVATPCIVFLGSYYFRAFRESLSPNRSMCEGKARYTIPAKKLAVLLFLIYYIGISAIIRADFNYIDDAGRVAGGYREWDWLSRFISNQLSVFLHADFYLTDISPLPQILAAAIITISAIIVLYVICNRTEFTVYELIAVVPLGLNPYFLECLSYKYDSPYMALSILGAVFPLLYRGCHSLTYIISVVIGTIIVCTTYQSSTGIFPMLVLIMVLNMWCRRYDYRKIADFLRDSVVGYILGILDFYFIIKIDLPQTYVSTSAPPLGQIIPNVIANLQQYYTFVIMDFKSGWLLLICLLMVCFIVSTTCYSQRNKFLTALTAGVFLCCCLVMAFGLYPALSDTLFCPRAMYGFCVLLVFLSVEVAAKNQFLLLKIPSIVLCWAFFTFSFTYGNALMAQKEYAEFRIEQVISDLNDLECIDGEQETRLYISGTIGYSPILETMPKDGEILWRLVPTVFYGKDSGNGWGEYRLFHYYKMKSIVDVNGEDVLNKSLPILKDTMYHTIYGKDDQVSVKLK